MFPGWRTFSRLARPFARTTPRWLFEVALASLSSAGLTVLILPLSGVLDLVNTALLYLLGVVLSAVVVGRNAAVFSAIFSSLLFAHVFVPPKFSLAISEPTHLITAVEMLLVALITGHLTAGLRAKVEESAQRERNINGLYRFARELAAAADEGHVVHIASDFLVSDKLTEAHLLASIEKGQLLIRASAHPDRFDAGIAVAVASSGSGSGRELREGDRLVRYLPVQMFGGRPGVLAVMLDQSHVNSSIERHRLRAFMSLIAVTLERVRYADLARDATLKAEKEELRSSLLSVLSHDIRTPLTSVVGLADTLLRGARQLEPRQQELVKALHDQAQQMSGMVSNLLEMVRLQSGEILLRKEWQPLEEVIGSSLHLMRSRLNGRNVVLSLAPDLPLLEFDPVLIERVLCNLLENAAKYAPAGDIRVLAEAAGNQVSIAVLDEGDGIPAGDEERIFEKFVQVRRESSLPGVGLGLAICKAIINAHNGRIFAQNRVPHGAQFTFTLPMTDAALEVEEAPLSEPEAAQ